MKYLRKVIRK